MGNDIFDVARGLIEIKWPLGLRSSAKKTVCIWVDPRGVKKYAHAIWKDQQFTSFLLFLWRLTRTLAVKQRLITGGCDSAHVRSILHLKASAMGASRPRMALVWNLRRWASFLQGANIYMNTVSGRGATITQIGMWSRLEADSDRNASVNLRLSMW